MPITQKLLPRDVFLKAIFAAYNSIDPEKDLQGARGPLKMLYQKLSPLRTAKAMEEEMLDVVVRYERRVLDGRNILDSTEKYYSVCLRYLDLMYMTKLYAAFPLYSYITVQPIGEIRQKKHIWHAMYLYASVADNQGTPYAANLSFLIARSVDVPYYRDRDAILSPYAKPDYVLGRLKLLLYNEPPDSTVIQIAPN